MFRKFFFVLLMLLSLTSCSHFLEFSGNKEFPEQTIPRNGLKSEFLFNNQLIDSGPAAMNGKSIGVSFTEDRFGNADAAVTFNGIDNEIAFEEPKSFNIKENGFSVSLWVKAGMDQFGKDQHYMIMGNMHKSKTGWGLQGCLDHHELKLLIANGKDFPSAVFNGERLLDNTWHHIAGTFDGKTLRLFFDGKMESENLYSGVPQGNDLRFTLGRFPHEDKRFFNGMLDDVRIYERALEKEEIHLLYAENGWGMKNALK